MNEAKTFFKSLRTGDEKYIKRQYNQDQKITKVKLKLLCKPL